MLGVVNFMYHKFYQHTAKFIFILIVKLKTIQLQLVY